MSTPTSDGGRHVIPPDELKCVWMTAGILSYQLCDRQLECEQCPLDQAMRMYTRRGAAPEAAVGTSEPPAPPTDRHLRDDRRYARGHCWVMCQEPAAGRESRLRIGLEPALACALLTPRAVVHTEPGVAVERGATHFWIVTEGGTFGVAAPLDGTLRATNALLHDRPHVLAARPLDEGWLYELTGDPGSKDYAQLMTAEAAARAYDAATARFRDVLRHALRGASTTMSTHDDDGTVFRAVADALGPERYLSLVRRVYG